MTLTDVHYLETIQGEMAARIVTLAVLFFVPLNSGTSPQGQSFGSTYSKVQLSEKATIDIVSTSVIRTSAVTAVSAKPPVHIGENGVASTDSSSVLIEPKKNTSTEIPVSTKRSSLFTKALLPSPVNPQLNADQTSSSLSSLILKPEISTLATANLRTKTDTKSSMSISIDTSVFIPSKSLPRSTPTKSQSQTVIVTTSSYWISGGPRVSESPTSSPPAPSRKSVDYKLILCVAVPLFAVLVFVIVVTMVLCIRRYRKLRRYRQHLVPLTDMDGSDDSDEDEQISDKEPVFMVTSVSSSGARPILSFENEND